MKIKIIFYYLLIFFISLISWKCTDIFEPNKEEFGVKSYINNVKCYDNNGEYIDNIIPNNENSDFEPYVSVQSWVVKGKDMLVSITVPEDVNEIYFGAVNSESEYMGLNFSGGDQGIAKGYWKIQLNNKLKISNTVNNDTLTGFRNYLVVLSSNKNIQLSKFELMVSCNTADGISKTAIVPIDVISLSPFQENLKVGFRPLSGYTYTISVSTPGGGSVSYTYDKNTGAETFNNTQSPNATLSYNSNLNIKWIDFSNPEFGRYSMNVTIQIELTGTFQYIFVLLAIMTEGTIDQVNLDAEIHQTGTNTAVGTVTAEFRYFDAYRYTVFIEEVKTGEYKRIPKNVERSLAVQILPSLTGNEFIDLDLNTKNGSTGEALFIENGFERQTIRIQNSQTIIIKGVLTSDMKDNILLTAKYNGVVLAKDSFAVRTWPKNFHENLNAYLPFPPPLNGTIQFRYDWESESGSEFDLSGLFLYEWVDYPGVGPTFQWTSPPYRISPYDPIVDPYTDGFTLGISQQTYNGNQYVVWLYFYDTHRIPTTGNTELQNNNLDVAFRQPYRDDTVTATQYYRLHDPVLMESEGFENLLGPLTITRNIGKLNPNSILWQYKIVKTGHENEPGIRILP